MFDFFLITLPAFAVLLGIIIFVHEFGHLIVAKAFGTRVSTFSLGFGPRLWGFARGGTDYRVSAVPLGGYVKLGGELPEEATGDPREFLSKPRWQRVIVYLAGPAMNVLLAIVLTAVVFMVGTVIPNLSDLSPIVGGVEEGSSAAAAGLAEDDLIRTVDGTPVDNWSDLMLALMTSPERPVALEVERDGTAFSATVTPKRLDKDQAGDLAGILPKVLLSITEVVSGGAAERAGLEQGDRIRTVDGRPMTDSAKFVEYIVERPGVPITLSVVRRDREQSLTVTPADVDGSGKIGAGIGIYQRYPPLEAVVQSVRYNAQMVRQTFVVLGKILSGRLSAKGALSGPIEIAARSGEAAKAGPRTFVYWMAFISLSIAIVNLLPIPILDGGQIFILLVEGAIRRDLSFRLKEMISQVGFVLIVLLMLTVIYFDIAKNWPPGFLSGS